MKSRQFSMFILVLGVIALGISVYQFIDGRPSDAGLSLVYATVFFIGGAYPHWKGRRGGKGTQ